MRFIKVIRAIIGLVLYAILSCVFIWLGFYYQGLWTRVSIILGAVFGVYALWVLGLSKESRKALYKELMYLSILFFVCVPILMYEVGNAYKSGDALLLYHAFVSGVFAFVIAVCMILTSRKIGVWKCIFLMILIAILFVQVFKTYGNIVINSLMLIPFFITYDACGDAKRNAK